MMRDFLKTYSPVLGFITPPLIYFLFFGTGAVAFSAVGLSPDKMLLGVGIISLVVWTWSLVAARSQHKYLKKNELNGSLKETFGINSISVSSQLIIWLFLNTFISNIFETIAFIIFLMLLTGNIVRVLLTNLILSMETKTSLASLKWVLFEEVVVYGLLILVSLTLAGTFF